MKSCANVCFLFFLSATVVGCAATRNMRSGIAEGEARLAQVEANGAKYCAPREFAIASAHMKFAALELDQGMSSRAKEHFKLASANLALAEKKSPPEHCVPKPPCEDDDKDGICADVDKCPLQPEDFDSIEDEDGCPEDQDMDGDGILDSTDQCVLDKEDNDGYEDQDGCPEPDNDLDGIADTADECVNDPEDPDGYEDQDGCPDADNDSDKILDVDDECPNTAGVPAENGCPKKYEGVKITETRIEINQKIFFAYNKAIIKQKSYGILATVANVLKDHPDITVSVEGHTDSHGSDSYNKKLSGRRAQAVMEHLVEKGGISRDRLTSVGWGEEKPIDSNKTNDGRAANRRVEFVRTDNTSK